MQLKKKVWVFTDAQSKFILEGIKKIFLNFIGAVLQKTVM